MTLTYEFVNSYVFSRCINTKLTNPHHWHARCPICGDSKKSRLKKRFHLDWNNGEPLFQCFNCGESGNFFKLYSILEGISYDEAVRTLTGFNPSTIKNSLFNKKIVPTVEVVDDAYEDLSYHLKDFISDTADSSLAAKMFSYLITEFRVLRKIPETFKLYYAINGKFNGRIIIPIFKDHKLIYFQGRGREGMIPKYLNPNIKKMNIIFNEEHIDDDRYVIITEGILDALSVGNNGTCILGKSITDSFLRRCMKLSRRGLILALDHDQAGHDATLSYLNNGTYSNDLRYFIMPKKYAKIKDLNNLAVITDINIYDFVVQHSYNKLEALVKLKLV